MWNTDTKIIYRDEEYPESKMEKSELINKKKLKLHFKKKATSLILDRRKMNQEKTSFTIEEL